MGFVMADKIRAATTGGGFVGFIVYGPQRIGKSSYALQSLKEVYGSWDLALKYTLFDIRDVIREIRGAVKSDVRLPAIMWDDCGVHGGKMLYFSNRKLTEYLQNLVDVIGINLGGLVMTTPSPSNLLKALRGYEFYRVKIFIRDGSGGRRAIGYMSSLLPSGTRIIHRKYSDFYNVQLPDDVWAKYLKKRKSYLAVALEGFEKFLKSPK